MIHLTLHSFAPSLVTAVGQVVTTWGIFESYFEGWLETILRHPEAEHLYPRIPTHFAQRADAYRRASALAFAACPPLVERYDALLKKAERLSDDRNILCHGMWLATLDKVTVSAPKGKAAQVFFYEVTEESVESLAEEIAALFQTFSAVSLSMSPISGMEVPWLTSL